MLNFLTSVSFYNGNYGQYARNKNNSCKINSSNINFTSRAKTTNMLLAELSEKMMKGRIKPKIVTKHLTRNVIFDLNPRTSKPSELKYLKEFIGKIKDKIAKGDIGVLIHNPFSDKNLVVEISGKLIAGKNSIEIINNLISGLIQKSVIKVTKNASKNYESQILRPLIRDRISLVSKYPSGKGIERTKP